MLEYLGELPFFVPIVAALVAIVVLTMGRARKSAPMKGAGVGLAAIALGMVAAGEFIVTPREQALLDSKTLVTSFSDKNWDAMAGVLNKDTRFYLVRGVPIPLYRGADQLTDAAKKYRDSVSTVSVLRSNAEKVDETEVKATLTVVSTHDQTQGRPVRTEWELIFRKSGDDWRMMEISPVPGEVGADALKRFLGR